MQKIENGTILKFDHQISFPDGTKDDIFIYCKKEGRRSWFRLTYQCGITKYYIKDWRNKNYKVIGYADGDIARVKCEQLQLF